MSEADLQRTLLDAARLFGWMSYHVPDSRRATCKGFPDLVLAHPSGQLLYAELKSARGRVSAEQIQWIKTLRLAGSEVYVWWPRDLDAAIARLQKR
jgi:hypothetical protein